MYVIYILPSTTHRRMKIDTVVGEPIHPDAANARRPAIDAPMAGVICSFGGASLNSRTAEAAVLTRAI
jgi:hypothetical protein